MSGHLVSVIMLIKHVSTFRKDKQQKFSDKNVLLLTHCVYLKQHMGDIIKREMHDFEYLIADENNANLKQSRENYLLNSY